MSRQDQVNNMFNQGSRLSSKQNRRKTANWDYNSRGHTDFNNNSQPGKTVESGYQPENNTSSVYKLKTDTRSSLPYLQPDDNQSSKLTSGGKGKPHKQYPGTQRLSIRQS